jgi:hypothetical protein
VEVDCENLVTLQNHGTFRAPDFDTPRISRIGSGSRLENTERATREFENRHGGIFHFNCMQGCGRACLVRAVGVRCNRDAEGKGSPAKDRSSPSSRP